MTRMVVHPDEVDAVADRPAAEAPAGVLVLANPYSGSGPNRRRVAGLEAALRERGLEPEVVWDKAGRRAALSDAGLPGRCRCVVSAGGDGSLTDVLNGLDEAGTLGGVALFHYPVGTENLFASELGHPRDARRAAALIASNRTRVMDLGRANGRLFHLMVSAGFDAEVVRRVDAWRTRLPGEAIKRVSRLRYAPRLLAAFSTYRFPEITLTDHGTGQRFSGAHVFVFNLPRYGGGLKLGAAADPTDGALDYLVLPGPGRLRMFDYGAAVLMNRHLKRGDMPHGRATRLTLETSAPLQLDGDVMGGGVGRVEITSVAGGLRVLDGWCGEG